MNPRVSRSSALASKATGYPIAKMAALPAVGYTLDEITNDITETTPASFEPSIDYVVTKVPRFTFEKFPATKPELGTQMKSVGEAMSIGRTMTESLQKAVRSMETDRWGFGSLKPLNFDDVDGEIQRIRQALTIPTPDRIWLICDGMRLGMSDDELYDITGIDPWFLLHFRKIVDAEESLKAIGFDGLTKEVFWRAKRLGFSDIQLANLLGVSEGAVRAKRHALGCRPVYKRIDTCAAEFEAHTL